MVERRSPKRDILYRWASNPAITIEDIPFRANTVFNGTPVVTDDGIYLLMRIEGQQGKSLFALARSKDGLNFTVDEKPVMLPATDGPYAEYEKYGIEDPRITVLDGVCYVVYTAAGDSGSRIAIAKTDDYVNYERIAIVSEPGNKDGILFPKKIGGRYVRFDRPIGGGVGSMWVSYSPDMINWGDSKFVIAPRRGYWDEFRIGASTTPIETEQGWLEIYHGVKMTSAGPIYRAGLLLLDLDDPSKVVRRSVSPVLSPRENYERVGDVGNVCFVCGAVLDDDGQMKIYYGAADTSICIATCTLRHLLEGF
jgi:beta-1,4-mannooligosaccharide/beta-1,4-mannosyl-N-acetylglucosamine phosphorylase